MKILASDGEERSWSRILRHLREDRPLQCSDVEFRCSGGETVKGSLAILSRTSRLLQDVLAQLPAHQGSLEADGALKILLPDVDRAMVEHWLSLVYAGKATVFGKERANAFTEFLKNVVKFTHVNELLNDGPPPPVAVAAVAETDIKIVNFGTLRESDAVDADLATPDEGFDATDKEPTQHEGVTRYMAPQARIDNEHARHEDEAETMPDDNTMDSSNGVTRYMDNEHPQQDNNATPFSDRVTRYMASQAPVDNEEKAAITPDDNATYFSNGVTRYMASQALVDNSIGCPDCGMMTTSVSRLLLHASTKHYGDEITARYLGKSELRCPLCQRVYKHKCFCVQHLGLKHGVLGHVAADEAKRAFYSRIDPNYSASRKESVPGKGRQKTHLMQCPECVSLFSSLARLYKHSAARHYHEDLLARYGAEGSCLDCGDIVASTGSMDLAIHYGGVHEKIHELMSDENRKVYARVKRKSMMKQATKLTKNAKMGTFYKCRKCNAGDVMWPTRSRIYQHLSRAHFINHLKAVYLPLYKAKGECHICGSVMHRGTRKASRWEVGIALHYGVCHKKILDVESDEERLFETVTDVKEPTVSVTRIVSKPVAAASTSKGGAVCPHCSEEFGTLYHLYVHASLYHFKDRIVAEYLPMYEKEGRCHICNLRFANSTKRHQILHYGATHKKVLQYVDEATREKYAALSSECANTSRMRKRKRWRIDEKKKNAVVPAIKLKLLLRKTRSRAEETVAAPVAAAAETTSLCCPDCDRPFSSYVSLLSHATLVHYFDSVRRDCYPDHVENGNACSTCPGFRETIETRVVQHYGVKHRRVLEVVTDAKRAEYVALSKEVPPGTVRCPQCSKAFPKAALVYNHAAKAHFRERLLSECKECKDDEGRCRICGDYVKSVADAVVTHYGVRHKKIFEYMDPETKESYLALSRTQAAITVAQSVATSTQIN